MRGLTQFFFNELYSGSLNSLLVYVKSDNTLDLEIRENSINIYYRGGNILRVANIKSSFQFHFNKEYLKNHPFILPTTINNYKENKDWNNFFPLAKQAMDYYFTKDSKQEREFQQLVIRENNNSSIANGTDYFIIDIEYDNHANARFDLIAVEWPSKASNRKLSKGFKPKLVVIEMKYGDGSFKGSAGIHKHINDFNIFKSNPTQVSKFMDEMGLIPCLSGIGKTNSNAVTKFADDIEMIFLIANHDPASNILQTQLSEIQNQDIKFITSNFMGYGLYQENVFKYPEFIDRYKTQILNEI
jgi:hypothetical protein